MGIEQDYVSLVGKLTELGQKRAVLVDREASKARERESLTQELKSAGVDLEHPEAEIQRLNEESRRVYLEAKARVEKFEAELKQAMGISSEVPTQASGEKVTVKESPGLLTEIDI